jgi:hypothetical protein
MSAPKEIWLVTNEGGEICRGLLGGDTFPSAEDAEAFAAEQNKREDDGEEVCGAYTAHRYILISPSPSPQIKRPKGQLGQ